jgi:hypothetical protein
LCFLWLGTSGLKVLNIQTQFHSSFSLDSQLLCCSFCSQQIERQVFLAPWVHGLHFTFLFSPSLIEYNPLYGKYKTTQREYQQNFTMDIPLTSFPCIMESFIWHHKGIYECFCFQFCDVAQVAIIHKNI